MKICIHFSDLIHAIESSNMTTKVCVPSCDYYARPDDFMTEEITFIDPDQLITALNDIAKDT